MKKLFMVTAVLALLITASVVAQAATQLTFTFDPNSFFDTYSTNQVAQRTDQDNPRRVHQAWASAYYNTWDSGLSTYKSWVESLGEEEGLSCFNIWLLDGPNAPNWGETLQWDTDALAPTGTAVDGWDVNVSANPWGAGSIIQWSTTDSTKYLRPGGADIGQFSFTGYTLNGTVGEDYTIWFGACNAKGEYSLYFDQFTNGFAAGDSSGWEGTLKLNASAPVPEPMSIMLGIMGLGSIAGFRRFRK